MMTRAYALVRLLSLGPMRWPELLEVTGWPLDELHALLGDALERRAVRCIALGRAGNVAYVAYGELT